MSAERVANALGGKQLMLVLDNCEHVIDAAARMAGVLLHTNAAIRVLATSREPLRVEGEHLYRVPPLAVPAEGADDMDELLRHGAVQLFVTRARGGGSALLAGRGALHLSQQQSAGDSTASRWRSSWRRARGAALGIEDLASRLDDRFRLLTGGRRTALPRHQTLQATLDWSYELLSEPERLVLHRLAIFAGGFGLEAAGVVAASAEIGPSAVVDCVASLVTKSLVTANVGDATDHHRLLETTRAYAIEKLAESGELTSVGRRHAEYYRDLFERAAAEWETQPAAEWSGDL